MDREWSGRGFNAMDRELSGRMFNAMKREWTGIGLNATELEWTGRGLNAMNRVQCNGSREKCRTTESVLPPNKDYYHQDSLFENAFQSRAHFVVHPEWISEAVGLPKPIPLSRPPWPWEQPRYRQKMRIPFSHDRQNIRRPPSCNNERTLPTVPYTTPRTYSFVQPGSKLYKAFY